MTANTVNRETVRDAFAALLNTALVGTGLPASVVYEYPIGKITESPTVCVASSGTARQRAGIGDSRWNSYFVLEVFSFVRDADADAGWTEAMVEDTLDLLDKKIADCVADNRVNANWNNISFVMDNESIPTPSEIATDVENGYKLEMRKVYIQKMDV
jgi:hypothetical protein